MSKINLTPGEFPVEWVLQRMRARGVTQRDLAEAAGVKKQTASSWFARDPSNRTPPKLKHAAAMAPLLECNGGVLMGLEQPRTVRYGR